jgi:precorrin-6Y C5,15-methyltransferase (decarboxylating)
MALQCKKGQVYAIEKNPDAVALIRQNKAKFQAENITVVSGTAPDCLTNLPAPTHIFIGGSSGEMIKIIQIGRRKNPNVRFVINTVTLETQGQLEEIRKTFPEYEAMEVIQVNISKAKKLGNYHLMMAQNPVCIASFGGESI